MNCNSLEYDKIAEGVFAPIFPDIAKAIVRRTDIHQGKLLDVGCGGGHLGLALLKEGDYEATFLDIQETAIDIAARHAEERGVNARFVRSDVAALPFPDESFDLVASRGSMPFWEEQEKAFRELFRVLRPGGAAYVGGGLGGRAHQERIRAFMKEHKKGPSCMDRSQSKALSTEAYIALFRELGAEWEVIENEDEGRWFLFRKKASV